VTDDRSVRNSRTLGVLDEILHDGRSTPRAVEIVGLGIAAEARCTISILAGKGQVNDTPVDEAMLDAAVYADRLIELGDIEDDLVALWRRRRAEQLADPTFEELLMQIVTRLQAWPV
jgi:hypothetical protein